MSVRTLNRTLAGEGTNYRRLLDQLRHELASRHLANPQISIGEVAFLLGFSELSAFYRAFKRWSGRTPAEFRQGVRTARASPHIPQLVRAAFTLDHVGRCTTMNRNTIGHVDSPVSVLRVIVAAVCVVTIQASIALREIRRQNIGDLAEMIWSRPGVHIEHSRRWSW